MDQPIYLDNHATTPVDPQVVETMLPFFKDQFGNIGSSHICGRKVRRPVEEARAHVAEFLGADPHEVVFTSGATESINMAIKGVAFAHRNQGRHIITCVTEHKATLDTCHYLESKGFAITYLPVNRDGQISLPSLIASVRHGTVGTTDRTILISLMGANNEIGTIHPLREIGAIAKDHDVLFHVDAAQTAGKIPFNVRDCGAHLASISGHKIYGPKGIGALYVRKQSPVMPLEPLLHGGGQEGGLRSGTLPVPLVAGLGKACELARHDLAEEMTRIAQLRDRLWQGISAALPNVRLNGHPQQRVPGNLHVTFGDVDGDMLLVTLKEICCSATSACSAGSPKPSHVLKAIGLSDDQAMASVRFGIGRFNTMDEIDFAIAHTVAVINRLRSVA